MRIVALEEHYSCMALQSKIDPKLVIARGYPPPDLPSVRPDIDAKLEDFGEGRLKALDESGISLQVMGPSGPGSELLPPAEAPGFAREMNDHLAGKIAANPDRYAGFAHLPLCAPDASAQELERCVTKLGFYGAMVNGHTDGAFLDDPRFAPVLAKAEELDVPIYVHPGIPPKAVRDAYFSNLAGPIPTIFSRAGYGWHSETAIHILRMALSGTLDRHPKLKLIIGHQGEGLPAMMERFQETFAATVPKFLQRHPSEAILDQVHVTIAGFYSLPSFTMLMQVFGMDKILFSVDYPFSSNVPAKAFLDKLPLSPADREKFTHGNAEKLLKLRPAKA